MTPVERDDWTYAEGLWGLARFLMVRLPVAAVLWIVPVYFGISPLTHLPNDTILTLLFSLALGAVAGLPLGHGLLRRTQLYGWVPTLVAYGAGALVVIGGSALVANLRPYDGEFATALVPVAGLIGAGAAIYKSTLLDA